MALNWIDDCKLIDKMCGGTDLKTPFKINTEMHAGLLNLPAAVMVRVDELPDLRIYSLAEGAEKSYHSFSGSHEI